MNKTKNHWGKQPKYSELNYVPKKIWNLCITTYEKEWLYSTLKYCQEKLICSLFPGVELHWGQLHYESSSSIWFLRLLQGVGTAFLQNYSVVQWLLVSLGGSGTKHQDNLKISVKLKTPNSTPSNLSLTTSTTANLSGLQPWQVPGRRCLGIGLGGILQSGY